MRKIFRTGMGEYHIAVFEYAKKNDNTIYWAVYRWYYILGLRFRTLVSVHLNKSDAMNAMKANQKTADALSLAYADMRKKLSIIGTVFFALCSFAWLASGLYVLEPNRINAAIIAFGWIVFSLASYTMYDDYNKLKKTRPQKF